MRELRERCVQFFDRNFPQLKLIKLSSVEGTAWLYNPDDIDALEAFAKEQQIKGMEAVRAEFERRKRHIRKSMLDIMFLKWIDAEIKKLKEGG